MSSKNSSNAAYQDCAAIMDLALDMPGLQYVCTDIGAAINFKHRCNTYRARLRKQADEQLANLPGMSAEIGYDVLLIRQVNEAGKSSRVGLIIQFDHHELTGKLRAPDGREIPIPGIPYLQKKATPEND